MSKYITGADQGGKIDGIGLETALIANDDTEQTLYSLTIPANTLRFGDLVRLWYLAEVTQIDGGGELRLRIWHQAVGSVGFMGGFYSLTSVERDGLEFSNFIVVDTGGGRTAARCVGRQAGVDIEINLTVDNVLHFTGQMTVADVGNIYRGLAAHLSIQ
jgi:hypothetical protein